MKILIMAACLVAISPSLRAQEDGEARPGLSRAMTTAIRFYEKGDDMQAMDRFMEILTKGAPSERSMANEYINLITHRMNSQGGAAAAPAPRSRAAEPAAPEAPSAPVTPSRSAAVDAAEEPAPAASPTSAAPVPPRAPGAPLGAADKAVMEKEIKARLHAALERSLAELAEVPGVRVVRRGNADPDALGIPAALLFQSGISFRRDARRLLDPLTRLVFSLGGAQIVILPEGSAIGDAKVLDMRRTMGISSALYQAGVAPPRVRVNLLNSQVDIPKPLLDFKGVVIVLQYDQPLSLSGEDAMGDELGPPISLGIFPQQIRPSRNQGAIIEFSASDPPAGLVSWKFQLLPPSSSDGARTPLQEVVGGGAVFHQIFWNARKDYFGAPLPEGRYECVFTALDGKDRRRTLHKWINVLPSQGGSPKVLATGRSEGRPRSGGKKAQAAAAASAAPSADFPGASAKPLVKGAEAVEISGLKRKSAKPRAARKRGNKTSSRQTPSKKVAKRPSAGHYDLEFTANTHQMTAASEKVLAQAAAAAAADASKALKIVGVASADEEGAASLADQRAKLVAGLLINRYQMDPKRIQVSSSEGDRATVRIDLVAGAP